MSTATGAHTVWVYIWEDENEFAQEPGDPIDDTWKIFGVNDTMDAADRANNPERMFRPFRRGSEQIIEQQFDGSWSADFVLTNPYWLQFFYGAPVDTEEVLVDEEYKHTFDIQPDNPPKSAHLIQETHYPDGEIEQTVYMGCAAGSIDFDVSVEDTVGVSIDGNFATEKTFSTMEGDTFPYGDQSNGIGMQPESEYRALHFGNSYLYIDLDEDGTPEIKEAVQDASVSLEGNLEMVYELGSRFPVVPQYLAFEPTLDYTNLTTIGTKDVEKRAAYGAQASNEPLDTMADSEVDGRLEFDAPPTDSVEYQDPNLLQLHMDGTLPEDYSQNNIGDPQESLEDDVSRIVNRITAEWTGPVEQMP